MSRLIDADKLKQHYAWWGGLIGDDYISELVEQKKVFDTIVDVQPTVDIDAITESHEKIGYDKGFRDGYAQATVDSVEVVRIPIKGYEGRYEIDNLGRVWSIDRAVTVNDRERTYLKPIKAKQLRQSIHSRGYKVVGLTKGGITTTHYVHRLVAEAFVPNPTNLPFVNHIDEDKTNNFADNLEWCTEQYNATYGKARQKQAKTLRGRHHTEEHKKKISESLKKYYEGKEDAKEE